MRSSPGLSLLIHITAPAQFLQVHLACRCQAQRPSLLHQHRTLSPHISLTHSVPSPAVTQCLAGCHSPQRVAQWSRVLQQEGPTPHRAQQLDCACSNRRANC